MVSGIRHQTDAAPPAPSTPAATRAALLQPAVQNGGETGSGVNFVPSAGAALAAQLAQEVAEDLRWTFEQRHLSIALGYDPDYGQHFILDEETVYNKLSS